MLTKASSNRSLRIDLKIPKPVAPFRSPTHQLCLTERNSTIKSPMRRTQRSERKVVSIDLQKKQKVAQAAGDSQPKKVIKMRKKADSSHMVSTMEGTTVTSMSYSQKKQHKKDSLYAFEQPIGVKCFEQIEESSLKQENSAARDWEEIIKEKKHQLYSQLYKMDKKVLGFERDLDLRAVVESKQTMLELVKRKTKVSVNKENQSVVRMSEISNIYKMSRQKNSSRDLHQKR